MSEIISCSCSPQAMFDLPASQTAEEKWLMEYFGGLQDTGGSLVQRQLSLCMSEEKKKPES